MTTTTTVLPPLSINAGVTTGSVDSGTSSTSSSSTTSVPPSHHHLPHHHQQQRGFYPYPYSPFPPWNYLNYSSHPAASGFFPPNYPPCNCDNANQIRYWNQKTREFYYHNIENAQNQQQTHSNYPFSPPPPPPPIHNPDGSVHYPYYGFNSPWYPISHHSGPRNPNAKVFKAAPEESGACEVVFVLLAFVLWFYSFYRLWLVWQKTLNFSEASIQGPQGWDLLVSWILDRVKMKKLKTLTKNSRRAMSMDIRRGSRSPKPEDFDNLEDVTVHSIELLNLRNCGPPPGGGGGGNALDGNIINGTKYYPHPAGDLEGGGINDEMEGRRREAEKEGSILSEVITENPRQSPSSIHQQQQQQQQHQQASPSQLDVNTIQIHHNRNEFMV